MSCGLETVEGAAAGVRGELPEAEGEAEGETEGETEPEVVLGDICADGNQDRLRLAKAIVQRISQCEDFTYVLKAFPLTFLPPTAKRSFRHAGGC